jgi:ankyrin repeat protein
VLRALLEAGADKDALTHAGFRPFDMATDKAAARLLVPPKAAWLRNPWMLIVSGDAAGLRTLVRSDSRVVRERRHWGATWLHIAARSDEPACAQALIEGGASVDARDDSGETPLIAAARVRAGAAA